MKKLLALFVCALVVLGLVGGCAPAASKASITLAQGKPEIDGQLKAYAAAYGEASGTTVNIVSCGGDSCQLGTQLTADYQAGNMPDIFQIQGIEDYNQWKDIILPLDGAKWASDTDVAFKVDGKVVGFPVAIEGWGLAYNKDLLDKAGIDPATLVNLAAYEAAFAKLDSMKKELGIDSVMSMAAGPGMYWVTADHNFNTLLSNGLPYGDTSVVEALLAGNVEAARVDDYSKWVELLFKYADKKVLTTGGYGEQVGAWTSQKAVFVHQGNWIDGDVANSGASFTMGFAPHGSFTAATDGIFVAAPSWYVINKDSKNVAAAKKFLEDLAGTEAGGNYVVKEAGMISPFKSVTAAPAGQLSQSVQSWASAGKVFSWNQYNFSGDFRSNTLGPIYNALASGKIKRADFVTQITAAFIANKK